MALLDVARWALAGMPPAQWRGGNQVTLLTGGDELFPALCGAIDAARTEVWLATYIFLDDPAGRQVAEALARAARRAVAVYVVVDGFGTKASMEAVREWLVPAGVKLEVFRPLDRWWAWLQPGQLRRLHQKLCAVDGTVGFVGGINIIDDRHDMNHGWTETPRLDYAVSLEGPLAADVQAATRAVWARAHLGQSWRDELGTLKAQRGAVKDTVQWLRQWRARRRAPADPQPMKAALLVRDNVRQRRAIERSYVEAIDRAKHRVDIAVPYFYPGRLFRRALRKAAARGVQVRLLLQGKVDYRIAAMAARALYDELRGRGVRIYEYTPAFLHAKVAVVDDDWATVGSSNIDPLSLLLNLEANVMVRDAGFAASLTRALDLAFAVSAEVQGRPVQAGWRGLIQRGLVAWAANLYLRLAGITGRY